MNVSVKEPLTKAVNIRNDVQHNNERSHQVWIDPAVSHSLRFIISLQYSQSDETLQCVNKTRLKKIYC